MLQTFVVFCQMWISHRYTYIPSLFNLSPISLPIPPLYVDTELLLEFPEPHSKFPMAIYFTYGNVSFHVTLAIHLTLSSHLSMSISLFYMSVSPLLPCKWVLQYHSSRIGTCAFSSVQYSRSVMSNSLWPHELQHARPACPSPTPRVYSNPCPSSQWCHPTISSFVVPLSSCPQSLSASGSFPMSQLFTWGGQSIGVSASASVLAMNIQNWSPLGWTGCISLQSKGLSRVFSNTTVQKHHFFGTQLSSQSNSHIHTWLLEKP